MVLALMPVVEDEVRQDEAVRLAVGAELGLVAFSSDAFADSPAARALMRVCSDAMHEEQVLLKGIKTDQTIFRLTIDDGPPARDVLGF